MRSSQRLIETVDPSPHNGFHRAVERGAVDVRRLAGVAADDEVDAHQGPFRKKRIEGAHAALESGGEVVADPGSDLAVVAVARHIDEHRHEAVETVETGQHAHPRALVELKNGQREVIERIFVDLEQLVARVMLQHVDQRLAGMAVGIESGTAEDLIDLAPQIRSGAQRARIGGRGQQPAKHAFADEATVAGEALHPDIVEINAPVHARAHRGLGHDDQLRFLEELADLRRRGDKLIAAAQEPHLARAQEAEAGIEQRLRADARRRYRHSRGRRAG